MLAYGFNHDAAERSFLKAVSLDLGCAMCWWGASLVLGPHVNAAMDPEDNGKAWDRLQQAVALAPTASPREQGFIQALQARYTAAPPEDRRTLDEAYAQAAGQLAARFPDDLDAATFHAEALMDLQPWDYYDADLRPKGHTAQILSTFQRAIEAIPYDEPPGWHAPTRHRLGAALLAAGDAAGAEAVYRQELQRNPANGWSLLGLAQSLDAQGRDSAEVREAMSAAWRHADVNLGASHF